MSGDDFTAAERERLVQELLELHFGCHPEPEALQARLADDARLRALQAEALRQAQLLETAARPAQPPLQLRPTRPWHNRPRARLYTAAAAAAVLLLSFGAHWAYCAVRVHRHEQQRLQLTVSGPKAVPAGAPWSLTVQTDDLSGTPAAATVRWRSFDAHDVELAHGEQASQGTATLAMPPSLTVPARVEVVAETAHDRLQDQLLLSSANVAPLVHVSTDRPVYKPGDPVYVRATVLDRLTLTPQTDAAQRLPLALRVLDPKGSPVLQVPEITIQRDPARGQVGAFAWTVPNGLVGGRYRLELSSPTGSFPPEGTDIVVMEYQQPRLAKQLVLDRKTYAPGAAGVAELAVERMGGGAAAGAAVRAVLVLDGEEVWSGDAILDTAGRSRFRFQVPQAVAAGAARFVARITDGGVVESALEPFVVPTGKVDVACYPEGGDLVAGVENRVYLECSDPLGRPVDGEGSIVAADGREVVRFRTAHQGRAVCALVPNAGIGYRVRLEGHDTAQPLPAVREQGVVLRALDQRIAAGAPARLRVAGRGSGPLLVAAFCRGVLLGQSTLRPDAGGNVAADIALPLPASAAGVLRVTVFDQELHPVAERLLQRAAVQQLDVELRPQSARLAPGGSQTLAVRTRDEAGRPVAAVVGLAVTDRGALEMGDEDEVSLQDQALLFADVDRLEDLGQFFAGGDDSARNADLLLGTRGWRRFVWRGDDAARQAIAAQGPWAAGALLREGFSHTPQVASGVSLAQAELAGMRRQVADARDRMQTVLAGALVLFVLLLLFEGGAALARRRRQPVGDQVLWGSAVIAAALLVLLALVPTMLGSDGAKSALPFPKAAGEAVAVLHEVDARTVPDELQLDPKWLVDAVEPQAEARAPIAGGGAGLARPGPAGPATPGPAGPAGFVPAGPGDGFFLGGIRDGRMGPGGAMVREYSHRHRGDSRRSDLTATVCWRPLLLTDAQGEARVSFDVSDAVTTWVARADAHGSGRVGSGAAQFDSVLPFHIEARLPVEASAGDQLLLPVAFSLEDGSADAAELRARVQGPLSIAADHGLARIRLRDGRGRHLLPVDVGADAGEAMLLLTGSGGRFEDRVERKFRIAPRGFPHRQSWGGTVGAAAPATLLVSIPAAASPGSGRLVFKLFPSPIASLAEGMQGLLREPHGCFEQASSSNYPNTLVLSYLEACGDEVPSVAVRAHELLPKGYQKIVGYECRQRGFEWFGGDPGHEALSAYGLLEFQDMARVYAVDGDMVERTRQWLLSRRDGKGGFQRNARALDSFGRAPQQVTDPYIVYALLYARTPATELAAELDALAARTAVTDDAYELALDACALQQGDRTAAAAAARQRLAGLQQANGSLRGSTTSITSSGGSDLTVETTGFAILAWLPDAAFAGNARRAVDFLGTQQTASGTFGATQATICALRALTAYAQANRTMAAAGSLRIAEGDTVLAEQAFAAGQPEALSFDLFGRLAPGEHELRLELQGGGDGGLPWACDLAYHSDRPADDAEAKVAITASLRQNDVEEGRTVALDVQVENRTADGLPMTIAVIGIPAGLEVTTKVLDDLKAASAFDLWELHGRELALYWRGLEPAATKRVGIDLLARIPGTSTGPASRAWLYYTPSQKRWAAPVQVRVAAAGQ